MRIKNILLILLAVIAAIFVFRFLVGAVSAAKPENPGPPPKVTICHATSSAENPWQRLVVAENAISGHFENQGTPKAGHEDDILLQGDVPCPDPETPVVDLCENIEGNQEVVPEGYVQKDAICVEVVNEEDPEDDSEEKEEEPATETTTGTTPTTVVDEPVEVFQGK